MEVILIDKYSVEIRRRRGLRHLHLRVRRDGKLRVSCGARISKREISAFVVSQREFIERCLSEAEATLKKFPPKKFASGETFLVNGERKTLEIIWSWNSRIRIEESSAALEMISPLSSTTQDRRKALSKHYRKSASERLVDSVTTWSQRMGLYPKSVSVRGQKARWGSCTSDGRLSLNWKLIAAPPAVLDYVVIHELAHIKHMNHSPQFWSLVAAHCPEFKSAKLWLDEHQIELNWFHNGSPIEIK